MSVFLNFSWSPTFLVVRHPKMKRHFYDVILKWVEANYPAFSGFFDVQDLPLKTNDWSKYVLHVPWLQDPVQQWSPATYRYCCRLAGRCDELKIPIINRVDHLVNTTKLIGSRIMSSAGLNVPKMAVVKNAQEFRDTLLGLKLPLFVREDWGHTSQICRAATREDAQAIPIEKFKRPVAIEFVDVRDPRDGLYRKYRYIAAGNQGIAHHIQMSAEWITRGENRVFTDATREEELAFISRPDPHHELFQTARQALGLDFVAFDYGYTQDGQMIVWEANPYPHLTIAKKSLVYRNPAMFRTLRAILKLYLQRSGLHVPEELEQDLAY